MIYKLFDSKVAPLDKKTMSGKGIRNNKILAEELHKSVIKKINKRKVYSQFKDNIWRVDLADMRLLSKQNNSLKDKKGISIINAFNNIIKQSNRKPNKIWVDQGGEFYNHVFKKWLSDNDIIMYSTFNEGKSVVAERFIRTLKNKLYKHMRATGKNVYFDVLDDVVNEYNNTKHNTIKMKPKDVKNDNSRVYIDEYNKKIYARFNLGDRVRISKFKNIFAKGYIPDWSKEIFIVNKINDTVPWTYSLKDLNGEEILGSFYDRELQKTKL